MVEVNARIDGLPKSGRFWKKKQVFRSSAQTRKGVLNHLSTTYEEKQAAKQKVKTVKELENAMIEEKKRKRGEERKRREEQEKRRLANEFKTTSFQLVSFIFKYDSTHYLTYHSM